MNDNVPVDLEQIGGKIATGDVVCLYLPILRKTWVLDLRSAPGGAPVIRLTPMARGMEERLRYLRRLRPTLPRPARVAAILWPRQVDILVRLGVFDGILKRVASAGDASAVQACHSVLRELRQLERAEMLAVVRGDNYHTVWARNP